MNPIVEEREAYSKEYEGYGEYNQITVFDKSKYKRIRQKGMDLAVEKGFKSSSSISNPFKRKDTVYHGISTKECSIPIKNTIGVINIPLLIKLEIESKLSKIKEFDRSRIGFIHIGGIQILIKAHFREGIDTPIKVALIDNRINDRKDAILGLVQGNLSYQKLMFTVYPKYAVNINDRNINKTLSLAHEFARENFMKDGSMPYSIYYIISYALTNSH
ncbi:hypothetical protein SLE2022_135130 [Rubroshorea leprosula]